MWIFINKGKPKKMPYLTFLWINFIHNICSLIDGIIGLITLGLICGDFSLRGERYWLDTIEKYYLEERNKNGN